MRVGYVIVQSVSPIKASKFTYGGSILSSS